MSTGRMCRQVTEHKGKTQCGWRNASKGFLPCSSVDASPSHPTKLPLCSTLAVLKAWPQSCMATKGTSACSASRKSYFTSRQGWGVQHDQLPTGCKRRAARPASLPTGRVLSKGTNTQQQETGIVTSIPSLGWDFLLWNK